MKNNFVKIGLPVAVVLLFFVLVIRSAAKSPIITNPPPAAVIPAPNAPLLSGPAVSAIPSQGSNTLAPSPTLLSSTNYFGALNLMAGQGLTTNFLILAYTNPTTGMATNVTAVLSNNLLLGYSTNILQFALPLSQDSRAAIPPPFLQNIPAPQTNRSLGTPPLF